MATHSKHIILDMTPYGLTTQVLTPKNDFEELIRNMVFTPEIFWDDEVDKTKEFAFLRGWLLKTDQYFNTHPNEVTMQNLKWQQFCDECVFYAAMNTALLARPAPLLDPRCAGAKDMVKQFERERNQAIPLANVQNWELFEL